MTLWDQLDGRTWSQRAAPAAASWHGPVSRLTDPATPSEDASPG